MPWMIWVYPDDLGNLHMNMGPNPENPMVNPKTFLV